MSGSRSRRALLLASLLLPLAGRAAIVAMPAAEGLPAKPGPLAVQTSAWVFPSRPLQVTLEQRGVLSGRRLAIDLFIDGNQLQRVTTKADQTQTRLQTPALAPGRYVLMAKAGREVASTEFRVIAWSWLAATVAGLLAIAGAGIAFARVRRRSRADSI